MSEHIEKMENYFAGIDLGGTRVKIGLVSGGVVVAKKVIAARPEGGLAAGMQVVREEIDAMLAARGAVLSGAGLAFPGLVDPVRKKILSTNKAYADALELDLEAWARDAWGVPFFMDNDARMATVGEWKYGAGRDTEDLVVMTIGTGIGTSAVIEGKLLRGRHFQAGILGGHLSIQYDGRHCNCGNIGCVEAYGSTWSLEGTVKSSPDYAGSMLSKAGKIDMAAIFEMAGAGDKLAIQVRQLCLDSWSAGVINLIHAYDPEVVVLGGGVMHRADEVLPYVTEKVLPHVWCPWGKVQIRATQLLSDAGILGVVHCLQHKV
jgi:glucokinase